MLDHKYLKVLQYENAERYKLENDIVWYKISLEWLELQLEEEKKEREEDKKRYEKMLSRYTITMPKTSRKETESKLKMCDDYTKSVIIKYIELDNFELVKNIAWVVNKDNSSDVISHMDWWLARNYAMIELLKNSIKDNKVFNDKIEWIKNKKK